MLVFIISSVFTFSPLTPTHTHTHTHTYTLYFKQLVQRTAKVLVHVRRYNVYN